jgi:hypothetical protein
MAKNWQRGDEIPLSSLLRGTAKRQCRLKTPVFNRRISLRWAVSATRRKDFSFQNAVPHN